MSQSKTIYHSQLHNPTTLLVKSDALKSKYKKDPDEPGYEYVFVEIDGVPRTYFAENRRCASVLAGHKGEVITVLGKGAKEEATLEIVKDAPIPERPREAASEDTPHIYVPEQFDSIRASNQVLTKALNAFWLIEKALQTEMEQARISGVEDAYLTPENFGGKAGTAFRKLDSLGLIDKLPDKPIWST